MDDEKLIDLVQANDVLYNRGNLSYISVARKKEVWMKIAEELKSTDEQVIKRYRELRDRFVRSKRMELIRGIQRKNIPYIVRKMDFLTPHVFNKRRDVKITWKGHTPKLSPYSERPQQSLSPLYDESDTFIEIPFSSTAKSYETLNGNSPNRKVQPSIDDRASASSDNDNDINSVNNTDSDDDDFFEAVRSFKKLCKSQEERPENEALHGFIQMIIATIEGMSVIKQTKAMLRATEVVMQIKMEDGD